jgi:hypothetical protein
VLIGTGKGDGRLSSMRLYTKYKVLQPARKAGRGLYWSMTAIGLTFLIWIWLNAGELTYSPPRDDPSRPELNPIWERARSNQFPVRPSVESAPLAVNSRSEPILQESTYSSKNFAPRPVQNVLEAQIALARLGISCGSIDGVIGPQTRGAFRVYQRQMRLAETGNLDTETQASLVLAAPALRLYTIDSNDLARLQPLGQNRASKAVEWVAEKFSASPNLIRRLNPSIQWTDLAPGTMVQVPHLEPRPVRLRAEFNSRKPLS